MDTKSPPRTPTKRETHAHSLNGEIQIRKQADPLSVPHAYLLLLGEKNYNFDAKSSTNSFRQSPRLPLKTKQAERERERGIFREHSTRYPRTINKVMY